MENLLVWNNLHYMKKKYFFDFINFEIMLMHSFKCNHSVDQFFFRCMCKVYMYYWPHRHQLSSSYSAQRLSFYLFYALFLFRIWVGTELWDLKFLVTEGSYIIPTPFSWFEFYNSFFISTMYYWCKLISMVKFSYSTNVLLNLFW